MEPLFRAATTSEIELITRLRVDFILDLHPEFTGAQGELTAKTRNYFEDVLQKKIYTGIVGELDGEAICCAGILQYNLPPLGGETRKTGHILNFFTYPAHRKRGYGIKMMQFIIDLAGAEGYERLFLNATAMGERLYRKLGFSEQSEKALILQLHR